VLRPASRSPEKGPETLIWLATLADVPNINGGYYADMEWRPPSLEGQDTETAQRLWEISDAQCASMERGAKTPS